MLYELSQTDLVLVRHAPVAQKGRLFGRTDVAACLPDEAKLARLRACLSPAVTRVSSPALRCRQTAEAIWGPENMTFEPLLWEQDFGDWDGLPFAEVPDIGSVSGDALAHHAPPNGESFADLCARTRPALMRLAATSEGPTVAVVHAGIVRACLAMALGSMSAALRFDVDCLTLTRFSALSDGQLSVRAVNCRV